MSAREKILRFLEENHNSLDPWCDPETGHFVDEGEAHMTALLDAFAHELAERQRAWALGYSGDRVDDSYDDGIVRGAELAADEIDPRA